MSQNRSAAIVLVSGGLDSAVCLYLAKTQHKNIFGLSFNYYARRKAEREAAKRLAESAGTPLIDVDVGFLKEVSDLADLRAQLGGNVSQAYVPARNLVFYGIAAHFAEALGAGFVYGGHIKTDALRFRDASESFFRDLNTILSNYLTSQVVVRTPLIGLEKHEVVVLGSRLGVPFHLTWSCYEEGPRPCGVCEACVERKQAFARAGVVDPLLAQ